MKFIIILLLLLVFTACSENKADAREVQTLSTYEYVKIIKEKNLSLTQNSALKYFFYTQGIDKETNEPNAEAESDYFYTLQDSKDKLILFSNFQKSNILEITENYILSLVNLNNDYNTLAATFKLDGTPINFLLLENSFGTNEFSIKRKFKQVDLHTLQLSDDRYDMEWIVHPTKGINKLTWHSDTNITVNKQGFFRIE